MTHLEKYLFVKFAGSKPAPLEFRGAPGPDIPRKKIGDVIPFNANTSKPVPLEFYPGVSEGTPLSDSGVEGKGYPYVDAVDPEAAKRISQDVGQMTSLGHQLNVRDLFHGHAVQKPIHDPRRRTPGNAAAIAAGKAGELGSRNPVMRRGMNYHTQEYLKGTDPNKYRSYLSWFDEPGIRPLGELGQEWEGIRGQRSSTDSGGQLGHTLLAYPPKWGWTESPQMARHSSVSFRRKGTGYGDTWKPNIDRGWLPSGADDKSIPLADRLSGKTHTLDVNMLRFGDNWKNKSEFLNEVNTKFPRLTSIGGPWTK